MLQIKRSSRNSTAREGYTLDFDNMAAAAEKQDPKKSYKGHMQAI